MRVYILFHHVFRVYVSMISLYFTIFLCLCIQVTDTISPLLFWYVYVSMISLYFTIFSYVYVSKLLTLFHHTLCVYVSMFLFYFTIYINHICYVSKLLTLFHHINCYMLCIHIYMFSHTNTNSLKIVSIIL